MIKITLDKGMFALVDDEDFGRLSCWKWYAWWDPTANCYYAVTNDTERYGFHTRIYMHREILGLVRGDGKRVDHRNAGETLNNQKSNLRLCTNAQNAWNQRLSKRNTSGFRGVSFDKAKGKWQALIRKEKRSIFLGRYATPEAAHAAYCAAATRLYGEFARF